MKVLTWLITSYQHNPSRYASIAQAVIGVLMTFGLVLDANQVGSIMTLLAILGGEATRASVTPNVKVVAKTVESEKLEISPENLPKP
jgi:hypothetical protein